MSKPTKTRAQLRRALAAELEMPFFRYFPDGYSSPTSAGTTLSLIDTDLTQASDYWNNQWLYFASGASGGSLVGDMHLISDFDTGSSKLIPQRAFDAAPTTTDTYEIHSPYNAAELHQAINRAIQDAFPAFFDVAVDRTLILRKDTFEYDLTGLTNVPYQVAKVWAERSDTSLTGIATSSASTTLVDTSADFSDVAAGWYLSVYDGTGVGQLRTVDSVSGTTITITSAWTTEPDTTSYYCVWNPSEQTVTWHLLTSLRFDNTNNPSTMFLNGLYEDSYGLRLMLLYTCQALELTAEASTTVVPQEFVVNKAASILMARRTGNNKYDRRMYQEREQMYGQRAELFRAQKAWRQPGMTLWSGRDEAYINRTRSDGDPLGWED